MSFDRIAPYYEWIERIASGGLLQRCRTRFLSEVRSSQKALIVGEGNGRFLLELLRGNPSVQVTCVEVSGEMIRHARRRLEKHGLCERVEFIRADILEWKPPSGGFDAIVTHFLLDCFTPDNLPRVIASLAAVARPNAIWLQSDFYEPMSGFAKWRARLIIRSLYIFFGLVARIPASSLTPPDPILIQHGFRLRERRTWSWSLLNSDYWVRGA